MKIKVTINTILFLVLAYPLILFPLSLFGQISFFLTAPYFFGVFVMLVILIIIKGKITLFKLLYVVLSLILLGLYNFTTIRYSLPLFFLFYVLSLLIVLNNISEKSINENIVKWFFWLYLILSIPFIFMDIGWDKERFIGFIGSPTVFSGIVVTLYAVATKNLKIKSTKFFITTVIVFGFVFLTKTRLILIFITLFPFIKYLITSKKWMTLKKLFFIILITTSSIYPLYGMVTEWFPMLVSIRYENQQDSSFRLRYYVFKKMTIDFSEGTFVEKSFGKGNEYSRNFVLDLIDFDLMPHNDFMRLLNDWGAVGLFLFLLLLYKVSIKKNEACYVTVIYMLLFYSNMVFNIFLISLILILHHNQTKQRLLKEDHETV